MYYNCHDGREFSDLSGLTREQAYVLCSVAVELPEMFNVLVEYLDEDDEVAVVQQTTSKQTQKIEPIFTGDDVRGFHEVVRKVPVAEEMVRYAVQIANATRPGQPNVPDFVNELISWGAGIRAAQNLILGSKARALLEGRAHVTIADIQALAAPVLRHRILLSYRAEAEGITVEKVIDQIVDHVKPPVV